MALLAEHPGASWDELFQMAWANRDRSAALIGQQPIKPGFRSPLRLSHGRLGYPLSGRLRLPGWRRNEASRLQDLYPTLDRHQLRQLLANLRARGDVGEQLVALEREQDTLASTLLRWTQEAEGDERESRRSFSRAINRAWRQDGGPILALDNVAVEILPSLPARFDHVRTLSLRGIELRIMPADFLQSFPCLESLRIMNNPRLDRQALFQALRSAPRLHELYLVDNNLGRLGAQADAALAQLTSLRVLVLRRNALVLTDDNLRTLARLPLTTLDLRFNNITLDTGLAAHFRQMVRLRSLDLSINPLQVAPDLGAMTSLESLRLHDCNLRAWPEGLLALMQRPHHALRMVELSGNHITQVPNLDEVLASPYVRSLAQAPENRFWRFSFNDMQPQIARRLRAAGVLVFEHDMFADPAATPVDWLAGASEQHQALWHGLFDGGANRELREVVERVGRSAQARQNARSLGTQVWRLLQRAADDTLLRERLNEIAGDFPASCGDAGADAFSALEIELLAMTKAPRPNCQGHTCSISIADCSVATRSMPWPRASMPRAWNAKARCSSEPLAEPAAQPCRQSTNWTTSATPNCSRAASTISRSAWHCASHWQRSCSFPNRARTCSIGKPPKSPRPSNSTSNKRSAPWTPTRRRGAAGSLPSLPGSVFSGHAMPNGSARSMSSGMPPWPTWTIAWTRTMSLSSASTRPCLAHWAMR